MNNLYTVEDLAKTFDVTTACINKNVRLLGLNRILIGQRYWYSEHTKKVLAEFFKLDLVGRRKAIKKSVERAEKEQKKALEQLKKEHPLVTDYRCFKLSWFPQNVLHTYDDEEAADEIL